MKMISQLEFGDKSESFRSAAKQFYVQNVLNQTEPAVRKSTKKSSSNQPHGLDGSKTTTNQGPGLLHSKRESGVNGNTHRAESQVHAASGTGSKKGR